MSKFFSLKLTKSIWIFLAIVAVIVSLPSYLWINLKASDANNKKNLRSAFDQISLPSSLSSQGYTYDSKKDLEAPNGSWVYRFNLNGSLDQTLIELKSSLQNSGYTITDRPQNSDAYILAENSNNKTRIYVRPDINGSIKIVQYKLVDNGARK